MRWITCVILLPALISAQSVAGVKWLGTGFQEFLADPGTCIKAFQATSPDAREYAQLIGGSSTGQTDPVVQTRLQGVGVQDFAGTGCIAGFTVSPPDAGGYVTLYAPDMNHNQGPILRSRWEGIGFERKDLTLTLFSAWEGTLWNPANLFLKRVSTESTPPQKPWGRESIFLRVQGKTGAYLKQGG